MDVQRRALCGPPLVCASLLAPDLDDEPLRAPLVELGVEAAELWRESLVTKRYL
jgi:hypothetical protein